MSSHYSGPGFAVPGNNGANPGPGGSGGTGNGPPAKGGLEELFQILELSKPEVVAEIKQLINEQFAEVRDASLVPCLYDHHASSPSARVLEVLLCVRDPHDKFLLDRLQEGLRLGGPQRLHALTLLGYVIRHNPPWLYKITQHSLMKEWIKVLKHEEDIVMMMSALLDLLAIMPVLPSYIASYLSDLFDVFARVASWRYQCIRDLPDLQKVHIQVGLYAFFHRLYGMFPCNFLSFLRSQYSEGHGKDNQLVFIHTIRPMLNTVRMHPLLVTHSRDQEKTSARWKRCEVHDVLVESSRYSLLSQESSKEEEMQSMLELETYGVIKSQIETPDIHDLCSAMSTDPMWTPGRRMDLQTPPTTTGGGASSGVQPPTYSSEGPAPLSRLILDSPPEAAIEATPETTPFVTPIKEDSFRFARPVPSPQVTRNLRMELGASARSTAGGPTSPVKNSAASLATASPFRFPDPQRQALDRRDSLFERPADQSHLTSKLTKLGSEWEGSKAAAAAPTSAGVDMQSASVSYTQQESSSHHSRPSPVKFTNKRPDQFPIKPEPERPATEASKQEQQMAMLSLDNLKNALPDFGKEEDDDEVTKITGGTAPASTLDTRHITPQICVDSGATSRTMSRISSSSNCGTPRDPRATPAARTHATSSVAASSECKSGGMHPPNSASMNDFVRQVKGRIRYLSVCAPSTDLLDEVASIVNSSHEVDLEKRSSSCPDERQIVEAVKKKKLNNPVRFSADAGGDKEATPMPMMAPEPDSNRVLVTSGMQTDEFVVFPYEHLFPQVLPHSHIVGDSATGAEAEDGGPHSEANPYDLLDEYMENLLKNSEATSPSSQESQVQCLKSELALTRTLMLYERQRREILGMRNRRLLGKTKSSRSLEEQNNALRDQLHIVEAETKSLLSQLESVRHKKHEVEDARAQGAIQRDNRIEELVSENRTLKEKLREMTDTLDKREKLLREEREETSKTEAALFKAKSELHRLEEKEDLRRATEEELVHLRQEILLLGEMQVKYKERLERPGGSSSNEKHAEMMTHAFEQQLAAMRNDVIIKCAETEAARGRVQELEQALAKKDSSAAEQKRIIKRIKDENVENLAAVEDANKTLLETQYHLETRIMQLEDQLTQAGRGRGGVRARQPVSGGLGAAMAGSAMAMPVSRNQMVHHSANMDIVADRAQKASVSTLDSDDKTPFVVGSPPLSSGGSHNSTNSEVIRRILRSDPVNLERVVDLDTTAEEEIGSAVSAKEAMASSAESSVNGKHH